LGRSRGDGSRPRRRSDRPRIGPKLPNDVRDLPAMPVAHGACIVPFAEGIAAVEAPRKPDAGYIDPGQREVIAGPTKRAPEGALFADPFSPCAGLELPDEHERDDQRVDDEDSISARPTIIGMKILFWAEGLRAIPPARLRWLCPGHRAAECRDRDANPAARAMTAFTLSRRPRRECLRRHSHRRHCTKSRATRKEKVNLRNIGCSPFQDVPGAGSARPPGWCLYHRPGRPPDQCSSACVTAPRCRSSRAR